MFVYRHKVHYYETDRMGVTHHSNYIRIMEEARVAYLEAIGAGYSAMEAAGIISPVIGVEASYKHTTTFDDEIDVEVFLSSMTTFKLKIGYVMRCGDKVVFEGTSLHCFLDPAGKPVSIDDHYPQFREHMK